MNGDNHWAFITFISHITGYSLNDFSQSQVNPGRVIKKEIWYAKAYLYKINYFRFIYLN